MTYWRSAFVPFAVAITTLASPALAADTAPDCPRTVKAADLVPGADIKVKVPLLPLSRIIDGSDVYCTETMLGSDRVRTWHERGAVQGKPLRIDHYDNGLGMGWGPKAAADIPVFNDETTTLNSLSFGCRSWKNAVYEAPTLDCTVYPALAEDNIKPVKLSLGSNSTGRNALEASINPRAFYDDGIYVVPNREMPLTLTYGDTTETLYFISGVGGMMSATLGGRNELDDDSVPKLLEGLMTGPTATLSYTDYEDGVASYTFSEADIEHAKITMTMLQEIAKPIGQKINNNFAKPKTSP